MEQKFNTYIANTCNYFIIYIYIFNLQTVKRIHEQSDLERIQDVFPNDFLRLYDKEALTMVSLTIYAIPTIGKRYYIIYNTP